MANSRDIRAFARDEAGAILVFWAMALAAVLGIVALSFDIGRLAATQSELQSYADQVALAAAGELDGQGDSITRATAAAANLISDSQTFGTDATATPRALGGAASYDIQFLSSLPTSNPPAPSDDRLPISAANVAANPEDAIYAFVEVHPKTVGFSFGSILSVLTGGAMTTPNASASAVAGFTQFACDITPMMFCIPSPGFDASDPNTIGDLILLRSGGQGAAWGPGDFGFLDPSTLALDSTGNCAGTGGTGPTMRCILGAAGSITQCFAQRGVDVEPGQKTGITNNALNVRFDMWAGAMGNESANPVYAPAANVIKGMVPNGNACNWSNPQISPDTEPLPLDDCFPGCGRYGDGNWSAGRATYVAANYGGTDPHASAGTRYEYYLAEIALAGGSVSGTSILTGRSETGRPMCAPNPDPDPERRVIIAAGVDCAANPIQGAATGVPVHQFVKLFLTRPVTSTIGVSNSMDIYAEVIGSAGGNGGSGGSAGIIHDVVQLYR